MRYEFAWVDARMSKARRYPRLATNQPDPFVPTIQYIQAELVNDFQDPSEREVADYITDMPDQLHIRFYGAKQYTTELSNVQFRGSKHFIRYDLVDANHDWMLCSYWEKHRHEFATDEGGDLIVEFQDVDAGDPYAVKGYDPVTGIATRLDGHKVWVHSRGDGVMSEEDILSSSGLSSQHAAFRSFKNRPTWAMREAYLDLVRRNRED